MKRLLFFFFLTGLFSPAVHGQGVVFSYDTLNDPKADFSGYKSKIAVSKFITRFGSVIDTKSKMVVGAPILSTGVFVSFLNGQVPAEKFSADGHKPVDAGFSGNFMVIKEMFTWNPALEAKLQPIRTDAEAVSDVTNYEPSEDEALKLQQYPVLIVAYATLSNGSEITITDLARALESGELADPNIPVITPDLQLQLDKIDLLLERGDINKARHKELQTDILRKAANK